ncbi:hypothetical protein SAMN02745121_01645 [Nannocystis exedens]|uniref:Uncharacterized protein n=1 Tax=Nannocystis exedens TaxID=54 RepID=A0A1I1VCH2_9BACT|nr:hypothetical protein [Nannocystis exedens]PCC72468.1 hypothetical protein NAEX_05548 [Nannocystis exedens]SFD79688.1 hypothetical protein SAMN02745121_01645 [Nannocystis exedens]
MKPEPSRAVENAAERRRFEEQVAWKEVDQLHAATLQFAGKCLELKKLCVALCAALVVWLVDKDVRFVQCAVLALALLVFFWLADAQNFYYQRKTRRGIAAALGRARLARGLGNSVSPLGLEKDAVGSVLSSLLNASQLFYFYVGVVVLVALALTHHA